MNVVRKRRGRGEGGIRFREDKGLWVGEVRLTNGKRRTIYGKTKKEVLQEMRKLLGDADRGVLCDAGASTVGQWLDRWLTMVKPTVEPGTYAPYEQHVRLHLKPHLGGIKLGQLRAAHVKELYTALAEGGVSAALQRKVGTTLTIALNEAMKLDLLPGNPASKVRKPKAERPTIEVLGPDEVPRFLAAAWDDRHYTLYLTALDSGARPSELFALRWPDVDFGGGFISITKSLEQVGGVLRVKDTKTAKSRRRVDLARETLDALAEHRKAMLVAGFIEGPVFCDTEGGYLRFSNLYRDSYHPILKRAGLPELRLYDLRHTCATLLLLADVPAKVVSERLGHSSITLTLDTYSHVLPTMQKRAAEIMGRLLGPAPAAGANGGTMAVPGVSPGKAQSR